MRRSSNPHDLISTEERRENPQRREHQHQTEGHQVLKGPPHERKLVRPHPQKCRDPPPNLLDSYWLFSWCGVDVYLLSTMSMEKRNTDEMSPTQNCRMKVERSSILHQNIDLMFSSMFQLRTWAVLLQRSRLNTCCLHEVWLRLKFQTFSNSNSE